MFSPNGWMGEKTENSVKMVSFLCSYCHAVHAYVYIHVLDIYYIHGCGLSFFSSGSTVNCLHNFSMIGQNCESFAHESITYTLF